MAISDNPIMQGIRGAINKQLIFRVVNGKQVISAYPDMSGVKRTRKQKKQRDRMTKVNQIVREIKADPQQRKEALIRLDVTSNRLHHALLKEQLLLLSREEI